MKQLILLLIGIFLSIGVNAQTETYKIGNTEYYVGKYYSTTGKPLVKRSEANKRQFLENRGYDKVPYGYEIDHIIPLSEGGTDDPSNMQLLTVEQHARKTARERANRSSSTYSSYPKYRSNSTYFSTPNYKSNSTYSAPSGTHNGKTIYTGKNGGKYYINSNGNKTYIKSNSSKPKSNNYSTPSYNYSTPSYNSGRTIHTGPRGGKYYINSNGNKTYIKKD